MHSARFPERPEQETRLLSFQLASPEDPLLKNPEAEKTGTEAKEGKEQEITKENFSEEIDKRVRAADAKTEKLRDRVNKTDEEKEKLKAQSGHEEFFDQKKTDQAKRINAEADDAAELSAALLTAAGTSMIDSPGETKTNPRYSKETLSTDRTATQKTAVESQQVASQDEHREKLVAQENPEDKGEKAA